MTKDDSTDDRVSRVVEMTLQAMRAWETGVRFSDKMTFEQAEQLNNGHVFCELLGESKRKKSPFPANVIDAKKRFKGGRK